MAMLVERSPRELPQAKTVNPRTVWSTPETVPSKLSSATTSDATLRPTTAISDKNISLHVSHHAR